MSGYYISIEEQVYGPYTAADLRRMAGRGELQPQDHVVPDGGKKWIRADRIKGLVFGKGAENRVSAAPDVPSPTVTSSSLPGSVPLTVDDISAPRHRDAIAGEASSVNTASKLTGSTSVNETTSSTDGTSPLAQAVAADSSGARGLLSFLSAALYWTASKGYAAIAWLAERLLRFCARLTKNRYPRAESFFLSATAPTYRPAVVTLSIMGVVLIVVVLAVIASTTGSNDQRLFRLMTSPRTNSTQETSNIRYVPVPVYVNQPAQGGGGMQQSPAPTFPSYAPALTKEVAPAQRNPTSDQQCILCRGQRYYDSNCTNCKGTGRITMGFQQRRCTYCQGTGFATCSGCKGSGSLPRN